MTEIRTDGKFQDILRIDKIQVLKSNPITRSNGVVYVGNGFTIQKQIIGMQTNWNGKKLIRLKTTKSEVLLPIVQQMIQPMFKQQGLTDKAIKKGK